MKILSIVVFCIISSTSTAKTEFSVKWEISYKKGDVEHTLTVKKEGGVLFEDVYGFSCAYQLTKNNDNNTTSEELVVVCAQPNSNILVASTATAFVSKKLKITNNGMSVLTIADNPNVLAIHITGIIKR